MLSCKGSELANHSEHGQPNESIMAQRKKNARVQLTTGFTAA